jgi:hypothetical protein
VYGALVRHSSALLLMVSGLRSIRAVSVRGFHVAVDLAVTVRGFVWMSAAIMTPMFATASAAQSMSGTTTRACPAQSNQREALELWSAAAEALRIIVGNWGQHSDSVVHVLYDRNLGTNGRRIVRQSTKRMEMRNTRPIVAERTPSAFVSSGYVVTSGDTTSYFGPNPEVLADSTFVATHCLSIRREAGDIGVAFVPTGDRDSIPDIAGVLWLSRTPLALRSLTFEYRNTDRSVIAMRAGGRLDFETLPNGQSVIRSWHIRSPRVVRPRILQRVNGRATFESAPQVTEVHETGGLIVSGRLGDGTALPPAPLVSLGGSVRHSQRDEVVPNASVTLDSTDQRATTDTAGRFLFQSLLPGPYIVRVADSMVIMATNPDRYAAQRSNVQQVVSRIRTIPVETRLGRVSSTELRLPWRSPVNGCGPTPSTERPRFVLLGMLRATDSASLALSRVRVSWVDSSGTSALETRIDAVADAGGDVLMCGIPAGRDLAVSVVSTQGTEFQGQARVTYMGYDANNQAITGNLRPVTISVARLR